jgi:hypothetical protein
MPASARGFLDSKVSGPIAGQPQMPPRILSSDVNHRTATWGPLFFVVWMGDVEVRITEQIQTRLRAHAGTLPSGRTALFTVVEETAPLPSSERRTALSNILRYCTAEVFASAVVMEGDGFRASAVRSVATGLSLVARQPFPHRVFRRVQDGAQWICSCFGDAGGPTVAGVCGAVNSVRAKSVPTIK